MNPARRREARFALVWLGQLISVLGSTVSGFSLGLWTYDHSGSLSRYGLVTMMMVLPGHLLSPVVGALVDRLGGRRAMSLAAGLSAATVAVLAMMLSAGALTLALVIGAEAILSVCIALEQTAYATVCLDPHQGFDHTRGIGLMQLLLSSAQLCGPPLAAALAPVVSLRTLLWADVATYGVALTTLQCLELVGNARTATATSLRALLQEARLGWEYLLRRRDLYRLLLVSTTSSLFFGAVQVQVIALILRTQGVHALQPVLTAGAIGMTAGSLLMVAWGGPRRRIHSALGIGAAQALLLVPVSLHPSQRFLVPSAFGYMFCVPLVSGYMLAAWQSVVPPALQGRAIAARSMIVGIAFPVGGAIGGLLAEHAAAIRLLVTSSIATTDIGGLLAAISALMALWTSLCRAAPSLARLEALSDSGSRSAT
jgi:MFS family permease